MAVSRSRHVYTASLGSIPCDLKYSEQLSTLAGSGQYVGAAVGCNVGETDGTFVGSNVGDADG